MAGEIVLAPTGEIPPPVVHFHPAEMPRFRFEFYPFGVGHPKSKRGKVAVIDRERLAGGRVEGFVIAEHCDTEARAFGFVQTFLRGVRYATRDQVVTSTILPEMKP